MTNKNYAQHDLTIHGVSLLELASLLSISTGKSSIFLICNRNNNRRQAPQMIASKTKR